MHPGALLDSGELLEAETNVRNPTPLFFYLLFFYGLPLNTGRLRICHSR